VLILWDRAGKEVLHLAAYFCIISLQQTYPPCRRMYAGDLVILSYVWHHPHSCQLQC